MDLLEWQPYSEFHSTLSFDEFEHWISDHQTNQVVTFIPQV